MLEKNIKMIKMKLQEKKGDRIKFERYEIFPDF